MARTTYIPVTPNRDALIYLAAIVDGEGGLIISKHTSNHKRGYNYQARLEISNTDIRLVNWIENIFGGRIAVYSAKQTPKNSRKTSYRWVCEGKRLTHVCELIYPFSIIKKEQIDIILKIRYSMQKPTISKGQCGVPLLDESVLAYRHELYLALKKLHCRS
jgi:hypothetical protein